MRKRCLSMLLALCMALALFPVSTLAEMSDEDAAPINEATNAALEELPEQETATLSDAEDAMTRGAWMRELVNLFGLTLKKEEYPDVYFPDIEESAYFDDIMIATKYGFVDVEAGDNFEPDAPLTREFAAHTVNFYLGIQHGRDRYTYSDAESVFWKDDAQTALDCGWFAPVGTRFQPDAEVSATEVAALKKFAGEVVDSREIKENVSDYRLAANVIVLPDTVQTEYHNGIMTITGYDGDLSKGDIFAHNVQGLPFVYRAGNVSKSGDVLTVETEAAPEEAVVSCEFSGEIVPEIMDTQGDAQELSLMSSEGPVLLGASEGLKIGKDRVSYHRQVKLSNGETGSLDVEISSLRLQGTLSLKDKVKFVTLSGVVKADSNIKFDLFAEPGTAHIPFGEIDLGEWGSASIGIDFTMEAKLSFSYTANFTIGASYDSASKRFSTITDCHSKEYTLGADGKASAELQASASLRLSTVAGGTVRFSIGPIAKISACTRNSGTPRQCTTVSAYLYAGGFVDVHFPGVKEYRQEWVLYSEKDSPIRTYAHLEDNVPVDRCTRQGDAGNATGGYTAPKFVTPVTSRYYVSGATNASSTWSGGASAEPVVIWTTADNNDGTVTVTGYSGNASILNIPETIDGKTVTAIGDKAFQNKTIIRIVNMPDTVTSIGKYAFQNCSNLTTISFGENISSIGVYAFSDCSSLTSADLPEGLLDIGARCFLNCTALESAYIPSTLEKVTPYIHNSGVTYDYNNTFSGCEKLNTVTFGNGIPLIAAHLFESCPGITHIEIPDTVTTIGNYAFNGCSKLAVATFGKSVSSIGIYAFAGCSLTSANLPEGLLEIGARCFLNCAALETIYIPSTLEKVTPHIYNVGMTYDYENTFSGCEKLNAITFGEGIPLIAAYLFDNCPGITHIEIPDTVTTIGAYAFKGCSNLAAVTFSRSVSSIGIYAFSGCSSLTSADLPEGLLEIGARCFLNCAALETIYIPSTLEKVTPHIYNVGMTYDYENTFSGCEKLNAITFGEGIPLIAAYLFDNCPGITHIEIPDTVTTISACAFMRCSNLATIQIPDSVTTISASAFYNSGLTTITIPDSVSAYSNNILRDCAKLVSANLSKTALTIPAAMFSGCSSLGSIAIPDGVKVINNETFKDCSSLKTAALPDSVTKIGNSAFADCAALTDLTWLPYTVTVIGNGAFQNCTGLTSAALPDLVSSLGENTFKGCEKLASFEGGADLLSIGKNCFQDCAALTDVDLVDGLTTIGDYAFQNCASLEKIVLPDSVTSIGTYIFQKDPALKDVTLSKGLTVIPSYAFANCTALERLDIPKGVVTIKDHAFYQDTNLKTFTIPASVANIEGNAFSYPNMTTVYGVTGSYAQSFANWQSFIDITKAASGLALASGANSMTIGNGLTVTPVFTLSPTDSTEVISLTSDDADIVSVENDGISLRGRRNGTTNVTATTSGNKRCVFSVTVDRFSGIEIASQSNTTEFDVGARKNLTGLAVNALFANGNRERIYDYTVSGFTTDRAGIYAVTITYNRQTAAFQIVVGGGDPDIQSGTMGKNGELQWTYNRRNGQVTVIGPISVNEPILVGGYSSSGELLSIDAITVSGGTAQTANGRDDVRLFWSDSNHKPKCGKITVHVT